MITMRTDVAMLQAATTEHAQSQKGSVVVEFALILPVFLLLLFGVISFSIALYDKTVLTMATREGARAGVLFVANRTDAIIKSSAQAAALQAGQNNLISFGPMTYNISTNSNPTLDKILTVSANVNYTGLYVFPDLSISAQTSMKLE
jgi:Flp pilus assembly protein TadG